MDTIVVGSSANQWFQIAVQATGILIAASIGVLAWWTSVQALHSAYRPVIRPVPLLARAAGRANNPMGFLVKNIGRGPAVAMMMFDAAEGRKADVLAELDIVEPLGPRPPEGEAHRVGRRSVVLDRGAWLEPGHAYRLLYQDIAGNWRETRLQIDQKLTFMVRYLGPKRWWHLTRTIPTEAGARGQVSVGAESN